MNYAERIKTIPHPDRSVVSRSRAAEIALEADAEISRLREALGEIATAPDQYGGADVAQIMQDFAARALEPQTCHYCGGAYEIKTARGEDFPCGYCG